MARFGLGFLPLTLADADAAQITPIRILARVSEEAAVFQENLPKTIGQEPHPVRPVRARAPGADRRRLRLFHRKGYLPALS
jgi:hypothetical protein